MSILLRTLPAFILLACTDYELLGDKSDEDDVEDTEDPLDVDDDPTPGDSEDPETASLSGRICDPGGEGWVVGALASIAVDDDGDGTPELVLETTTGAEGWFQLDGIPLGDHVLVVTKGSFSTSIPVSLTEPGLLELTEEECLEQNDVRIAVVSGDYDAVEHLLDRMELEYDLYDGWGWAYVDLLRDPAALAEYDIIFFNCGLDDYGWIFYQAEVGSNLANFVRDGGSIYTSDWAYYLFESAFPDAIDFYQDDNWYGDAMLGMVGDIMGTVEDEAMQELLGSDTADLTYDLDGWVVPVSVGGGARALVTGTADTYFGERVHDAPLAVRLDDGGTAIYTSFHNEAQVTTDMEALLHEIILSL